MSLLRSQLVAEVYEYCGNPDDRPLKEGGLPQQFVFQVLTEGEDEMLRDLELSSNNRRVGRSDISPDQDNPEFTVSASDFSSASYLALQTDPTSNVWVPVEIVNHGSLLPASLDGRLAVAFRDTPPSGEVSWIPDSGQVLRMWYDRSGNDAPQLAASTDLGNLYDSHLKVKTAAQCRELMGLPVGDVLKARLVESQRQWKRYVGMSRQQGVASKPPVFTPNRLLRRYPFFDPTRFYLPR